MKEKRKKANVELRELKNILASEKKKRSGNADSMENLLYIILEESNIKKQHFHGGAMNGVCCRRLLDNTELIFGKIEELIRNRMNDDNKTTHNVDLDSLTSVIVTFKKLFECMDVVFVKLQQIDPTVCEIEEMKVAIKELELLWNELELSVTPKFHILTVHTIQQVV